MRCIAFPLQTISFLALSFLAIAVRPADAQLDPVIVTATRFPENARRLPASITVLSAADIRNSSARTLPEMLAEQVGLTAKDLFGNNAAFTTVDLRGFGANGTQNTLILVDGRRATDIDLSGVQWSAIPLSSIERIEILRGAGAVLYGDGATTGVVNIIMRSPLEQGSSAELTGRTASFSTLEGRLFGSAATHNLGVNATIHTLASDGYRENNRNEQLNGSLNLRWGTGDTHVDLRLGIDQQGLRLPGARRVQPSTDLDEYADSPRAAQTPLDSASRDGTRAGLTFATTFGSAELNVGVDWRSKDQDSYFDQDGFPIFRRDALSVTSFTPRLRLPASLGGTRHRITIGDDWHMWSYDSRRSNLPANIGQPVNTVRVEDEMHGLYLQDIIELSDNTLVTLGWREDRVRFDATDLLDPDAPGADFASEAPAASRTQRQRAWELGLRHSPSTSASFFARAQRSFRFVNVDEIYESDENFSKQFQILRPQTARTFELGGELQRSRGALRLTLFHMDVDDEIHLDPFTSGVGNTNLPPSRRQGVELEGRLQASAAVRISAGYAFTSARFREGVLPGGPFVIGTEISIAGRHVPLVPEHKIDARVVWDVMDGARLSAGVTSVSKQYMDNDEPNTLGTFVPAYAVVDLTFAHDFAWGRITATGNNLLGERYFTYGVRSQFTADRYAVYPLPGRGFSLAAELKLD